MTLLVQVGEMGHMCVLELGRRFFVELGSVRAQDQQGDRVAVEFHLGLSAREP
jgi:hypothetical protein